jgi:transposase-like protein
LELDTKIYTPNNIIYKKKKVSEYSCIQKDETIIKAGSEYIWLRVAIIEPKDKEILGMSVSKERQICLLHPNVFCLAL